MLLSLKLPSVFHLLHLGQFQVLACPPCPILAPLSLLDILSQCLLRGPCPEAWFFT
eukprot:m.288188 g.288188  ORF g.288188 m.288188 type:complete len:56 (-) comp11919_c0_seq1:286-453(-)